jgi:hypothetical protein
MSEWVEIGAQCFKRDGDQVRVMGPHGFQRLEWSDLPASIRNRIEEEEERRNEAAGRGKQ